MYENFSTDHRLTSATSSLNSGMAASSMVTSITPQMTTNKSIPPDRFLTACPIKYECRRLFVNLLEMEYSPQNQTIETILQYPDKRDETNFKNEKQHNDFMENVKKFAFPYVKTIASNSTNSHSTNSSQLVQFYTFVFTDENRIRQYGFCRSAQSGNHILCIVSYLPWYNVFISILNKISTIINEKETTSLYYFLEALYEYELPDPGNYAQIFSHDGSDEMRFQCPDRRVIPSIHENRNLLKFFAFFDLEKLIKIFTALLLERSLLIVSKDIENLTSCGLSLEYLLYPLEWLHTFVPIMPEHVDVHVFNQPFPFIYGIHPCIYEKINKAQLESNVIILLVDERQILNADKDHLPENVTKDLFNKLKYFVQNDHHETRNTTSHSSSNIEKYDLLRTGPIKAFQEAVLTIIDNYRDYLQYDYEKNEYKLNEVIYFQMKGVYNSNVDSDINGNVNSKYASNENEFYHEFRITQAFEEFCRDRGDYLKLEKQSGEQNSTISPKQFQKDFIEHLFEQYKIDNPKLPKIFGKIRDTTTKISKKVKENLNQKKLLNTNSYDLHTNSNSSKKEKKPNKKKATTDDESKLKPKAIPSQVIEIINMKLNNLIDKQPNMEKLKTSPVAGLDFENEEYDNEHGDDSNSESSSSSSSYQQNDESIKEAIRRAAEATGSYMKNQISSNNLKRITIDLSNDPDIKKYFESNVEENSVDEEDMDKTLNMGDSNKRETNVMSLPLIDIFDEENSNNQNKDRNKVRDLNHSIQDDLASIFEVNANKEDNKTTQQADENPFTKDRFIDQQLDSNMVKSANISIFHSDSKMNINNLINNFNNLNNFSNTIKHSNSVLNPTATKTLITSKNEKPTYQQIIDEFDPINQSNSVSEDKRPIVTGVPLIQNSFANLTPRPFSQQQHTGSGVNMDLKFTNRQSMSPQKPNYNVNLPLVNSSQMFRHPQINYNNNFTLPSSQSFANANTMSSPYYASSFNSKPQSFRPVNFTAPINSNNNKFAPRSNSTDFSKMPNNQPPQ